MPTVKTLQTVRLMLDAAKKTWRDTGVVVLPGEYLEIEAEGEVIFGTDPKKRAYPEGAYSVQGVQHPSYDVGETVGWNVWPDAARQNQYPASNVRPVALAGALRGGTAAPSGGMGGPAISDALAPNRYRRYSPLEVGGGGRLWLIFNDRNAGDNKREFTVSVRRLIETVADVTEPSPIRFVPPGMFEMLSREAQAVAWIWTVTPKNGAQQEAWTSWDEPILCPAWSDDLGNALPALTYLPNHGVDLSSLPASIKLGVHAPDVTVLNLDRVKLLKGFYDGAEVQVDAIDPLGDLSERVTYLVGRFGNAEVDDDAATVELTPFEELLNVPLGRRIQFFCDVGRLPGETFGRGRCRNQVLHDGPDIINWTRGARVLAVSSLSRMVLAPQSVGGFAGYENNFPASHGRARFFNDASGGENGGVVRDIGTFAAATGTLTLRRALPFLPAVGDLLELEAGCDFTPDGAQGCGFWNNLANYRGFPFVPGEDGVRRRIRTG